MTLDCNLNINTRENSSTKTYVVLVSTLAYFILISFTGCKPNQIGEKTDKKTIVSLWVKWEGSERNAIERLVDQYNQSQEKNFVRILSVSDPKKKLMLAIANGHPPDLAYLFYFILPAYAENNALTPLDSLFEQYRIEKDDFTPSCLDAVTHKGFIWGIPTTSTATALHYNKSLLNKADIESLATPKTLEELEAINDRLFVANEIGKIQQMGFLPIEPDWWLSEWAFWFGGEVFNNDKLQINMPAWKDCSEWLASYPNRFGASDLMKFKSSFGGFASSQNAFFTGKVAMVHQGMWMENFVQSYASPNFEYGIAPMPAAKSSGLPYVSIIEPDTLCIPRGAKHVAEAMDFVKFLLKRENLEQLALGQRKLTSLSDVSLDFLEKHPHPFIHEFQQIASSPYSRSRPKLPYYGKYQSDIKEAFTGIFFERSEIEDALNKATQKQQESLDKNQKRWNRVSSSRIKEWSQL
ncbi:extracellular solute-binding protein [Puniceicoccaceae bacterium K14]|nr:extracellular solute-binding protein [Puniceicoccaceae bacterium K14]